VEAKLELVGHDVRAAFLAESRLLASLSAHVMQMPGKKFRPTLLLLVAGLTGEVPRNAVRAAAVVELTHLATLIHDDSIDKSLVRRGLPTINNLWSDRVAIILGDYIYTRAFHDLVERGEHEAVRIISNTANRMTLGEILQMEQKADLDVGEKQYLRLISEKTASLISAACEIGAATTFRETSMLERFRAFGHDLGMAYQITDDLFDYTGDASVLGKDIASDLKEGKITLPVIFGLRDAPEAVRDTVARVVKKRDITADEWTLVTGHLGECGAFAQCREMADGYAGRAKRHLEDLPGLVTNAEHVESLMMTVDFVTQRIH
jgi:octaprenyl-diphosphate synthase